MRWRKVQGRCREVQVGGGAGRGRKLVDKRCRGAVLQRANGVDVVVQGAGGAWGGVYRWKVVLRGSVMEVQDWDDEG